MDPVPDPTPPPEPTPEPTPTEAVISVDRLVVGGAALGHEESGRVALVRGALPGETVRIRVLRERPRSVDAEVVEVIAASSDRVEPPCPELARGCGGCDMQHAAPAAQRSLKAAIVSDALARSVRAGRLDAVPVEVGPAADPWGYRSTVRGGVDGGRFAFHRHHSDDLLAVADCAVAADPVAEVIRDGRFPDGVEVTIRAGLRTGERLVILDPGAAQDAVVPDGVRVIGGVELSAGQRAWFHEEVAGVRLRISARSFFQSGPSGAEALVDSVRRAVGTLGASDRLADLYGGVGLFAAVLGAERPIVVERSAASVADARVNLADRDATIVRSAVERWRPSPVDVVVADPARSGLGRDGVRAVAATGAGRVVLISCDAAALVRDLELLMASGYRATRIEVLDLFPHTHHVEVVSTLELV